MDEEDDTTTRSTIPASARTEEPIIVEPTLLVEPESNPTQMPVPAPMVETAPIEELAPMMESEPLVETEYDHIPKLMPKSVPEEVKLLHEYLDLFLPPELGIPSFQLCLGKLLLWWIVDLLTP